MAALVASIAALPEAVRIGRGIAENGGGMSTSMLSTPRDTICAASLVVGVLAATDASAPPPPPPPPSAAPSAADAARPLRHVMVMRTSRLKRSSSLNWETCDEPVSLTSSVSDVNVSCSLITLQTSVHQNGARLEGVDGVDGVGTAGDVDVSCSLMMLQTRMHVRCRVRDGWKRMDGSEVGGESGEGRGQGCAWESGLAVHARTHVWRDKGR
eukprot:365634-Chlamydomonas_euryale.AAC.4